MPAPAAEIVFAPDLRGLPAALDRLAPSKIVTLADAGSAPHAAGLGHAIEVASGEASKSWRSAGDILDAMLRLPIDRRTVLVAVGGGMVGDLGGFCAAVALRGIRWVTVPTTLLAMVDSAVGGKTAVNHPAGKNLIGAFHPPSLVWAAESTLATLPAGELRAGMGEVVKTALLAGEPLWTDVLGARPFALAEACATYKASVVADDPREAGRRAILNLGHTLGHAWEIASGFGLRHGEAVALGLVAEARVSVSLGLADAGLPGLIADTLTALGLPVDPPATPVRALRAALALDKKAAGDILVVPLLRAVGDVALVRISPDELLERAKVPQ